jgi:hypothetical protein
VQLAAAIIFAIGLAAPPLLVAQSDRIGAAEAAALSWLAQIDVGAYDESWDQATGLIQRRDKAAWTAWMRERRGGLGDLLRRTIVYARPGKFAKGEAEGENVEIEYDTDFSGLSHSFEYVKMVRREDGYWRICWYFVRQRSPTELSEAANR